MPGAVGYESYELFRFTGWPVQLFIHYGAKQFYQVNVHPFIVAAYIIGRPSFSIMEYYVYSPRMVFYTQPVAYVFTLTKNRDWFHLFDIINGQRYQFLRIMERTVVI